MSGIVGVFDRSGSSVVPADVESMHARLAHRGPDGEGVWRDDRVGLGHQQLATTPASRLDDQPRRDGGDVLTADVRLDNREPLMRDLSIAGPADSVPDSQLILAAYRRWGRRCPEHLLGSFAFAIWDASRRRLFCARDRIGVKPLYYALDPEMLAFASEPKALLALETVPGVVDDRRVGDFLTGRLEDERISFYESIARLEPAHAMIVEPDGLERWRYWDLDPTRRITLSSDAAYERRFRELLEQAVRCRFRAAGSVGTELSGGLDSSSITLLARDLLPDQEPLPTFSNVFDAAASSDEREFIEPVVDRGGISPHYVFLDDCGVLVDRDRVRAHFDIPPHNTLHFGEWELLKRASDEGVSVLLSGALGDSATNYGLGVLPQLFRTGRLSSLWSELTAMSDVVGASRRHLFARHVLSPLTPDQVTRGYRRVRGRPVLEAAANPTLDPSFVDRIDLRDRYRSLDSTSVRVQTTDRLRQYEALRSGRHAANLEARDLLCAAFGVEPRYPFTDVRLLEFSLAIPPTQQFADGYTRSIIRRSLDDLLPSAVQWRPWKTSLNEGFWNALAREEAHLEALIDDPGPLAAYVDPDAFAAASDRFRDAPTARDARALWRGLSLATWLESAALEAARSGAARVSYAKYVD